MRGEERGRGRGGGSRKETHAWEVISPCHYYYGRSLHQLPPSLFLHILHNLPSRSTRQTHKARNLRQGGCHCNLFSPPPPPATTTRYNPSQPALSLPQQLFSNSPNNPSQLVPFLSNWSSSPPAIHCNPPPPPPTHHYIPYIMFLSLSCPLIRRTGVTLAQVSGHHQQYPQG